MDNAREDASNALDEAYGGFNDVASFRRELGDDVASVSDDDALRIVDESLREKARLSPDERRNLDHTHHDPLSDDLNANMRDHQRQLNYEKQQLALEKQRVASETQRIAADKSRLSSELYVARMDKSRLNDELNAEKSRRLFGDRVLYTRGPSALDDFLVKERIKRDVKDELLDEKRKAQRDKELAKLWHTPKPRQPSHPRAPSKAKPRSKSKAKPRSKSKAKPKSKTKK
jgi:hypothetical protein